jgi:exopolyphosphatase/guanosine-5'-triphosphate,3'-diphosphate pyrophosphatase
MRVAAVDIGTNSVRLLVADYVAGDLFGGERLEWKDRRVTVARLGEGVDAAGRLSDAAMGRTVAILAGYGEAIRAWNVDARRAIATSATRDAANRDAFLAQAELALGFRPTVIDGREEATLSFRGVTAGLVGDPPFLVIDPGGGSTEFVLGTDRVEFATSVDVGSVRLTERGLPQHPASEEQLTAARRHVDELLESVTLPATPGRVVGVGGTFTSLAAIALDLPSYEPDVIHGAAFPADLFMGLVVRFAALTVEETAAIPSLDPGRADVLLGGAIVVERAIARSGATEVMVSEADILDGVALSAGAGR